MNRREFFNEIAQQWEQEHEKQEEKERLEEIFSHFYLSEGNSVMDAGCGTGRLIPYIRKKIGSKALLVECDFAGEMLRIAKAKFKQQNLYFIHADAQSMPLKENIFDALICFGLFAHLADKKRALKEFHRILKPGKQLFIAHPMSREELNRFHSQIRGPVEKDFLPHEREMEKLFSSTGFCELTVINRPHFYFVKARA
ncbi:MAG: class I SAM-dependent methyltransferase [Candidatus Aminicenantales bacterium]